jgi:hypothetical protein
VTDAAASPRRSERDEPRRAIDEIWTEEAVFYDPKSGVRLALTFSISRLPNPRSWAMAVASNGYRAALVKHLLTPGLISSSSGTAGLPPFISFSTSYPELRPVPNCMARRGQGAGTAARPRCFNGGSGIEARRTIRCSRPRGAGRLLGGGRSLSPRAAAEFCRSAQIPTSRCGILGTSLGTIQGF